MTGKVACFPKKGQRIQLVKEFIESTGIGEVKSRKAMGTSRRINGDFSCLPPRPHQEKPSVLINIF